MIIETVSKDTLSYINTANEPYQIIGRILPQLENQIWSYQEKLADKAEWRQYPDEENDWSSYVNNCDKTIFFAFEDGACAGQITIRRDWNLYAFIEDISVAGKYRGGGIGSGLMDRAVRWAREAGLKGIALETQDTNVLACRFYHKYGMEIGGVNTMLYRNFEEPYKSENAVFWYLKIC